MRYAFKSWNGNSRIQLRGSGQARRPRKAGRRVLQREWEWHTKSVIRHMDISYGFKKQAGSSN